MSDGKLFTGFIHNSTALRIWGAPKGSSCDIAQMNTSEEEGLCLLFLMNIVSGSFTLLFYSL